MPLPSVAAVGCGGRGWGLWWHGAVATLLSYRLKGGWLMWPARMRVLGALAILAVGVGLVAAAFTPGGSGVFGGSSGPSFNPLGLGLGVLVGGAGLMMVVRKL